MRITQKQWKVLNKLARPYAKQQTIESIKTEDGDATDPREIANAFNVHFTQIGPKLANSIQAERYTPRSTNHSFDLHLVDPDEISKIITQLCNAAPGYDQMQALILKSVVNIIAPPLSALINMSFEQGTVPVALKKGNCNSNS